MSEAIPYVFCGGMALIFCVVVAVFFYGIGHGQGMRDQKEAEATARAARNSKPGDLTPCRDPQAVAEAMRKMRNGSTLGSLFFDDKGHAYRLPASPREEIALTMLSLHYNDQEDAETNVANFFLIADEFIKQADGRDAE